MNTTQRKYAVKRATAILRNKYAPLPAVKMPSFTEYPEEIQKSLTGNPRELEYYLAKHSMDSVAVAYRDRVMDAKASTEKARETLARELACVSDQIMLADAPEVSALLEGLEK